jgi:hypothetical protein
MTEIKDLRRRANKLRGARYKFIRPDQDPGKKRLDEWAAEAAACRARLDYWHNVLVIGREIRAPVRLYDCWNRVDTIADLNEFEVQYFRYLFLANRTLAICVSKIWPITHLHRRPRRTEQM